MPDPFKKVKIIELMELFDDDEVTTADKIDPPEENPYRAFMERNPPELAGGGMLVEPGFGGVRQGYSGTRVEDNIRLRDNGNAYDVEVLRGKDKTGKKIFFRKSFNLKDYKNKTEALKAARKYKAEKIKIPFKTGIQNPKIVAKDNKEYMKEYYKQNVKLTKAGELAKEREKKIKSFIGKKKKIKASVLKDFMINKLGYKNYDAADVRRFFPNLKIEKDLVGGTTGTRLDKKKLNIANRYANLLNKRDKKDRYHVSATKYEKLTDGEKAKILQIIKQNDGKFKKDFSARLRFDPKKEKLIMENFNLTEDDFIKHGKTGVPKTIDGKLNPKYTAINTFVKNKFKFKKILKSQIMNLDQQEFIKNNFELPEGKQWNFKSQDNPSGFKYGVAGTKGSGTTNLANRIKNRMQNKKLSYTVAADTSSPKGWMINAMNRLYEREIEAGVKPEDLTYKPKFDKKTGIIIGFTDTTAAGGNGTYYGLNKNTPEDATPWAAHKDFNRVAKFLDIAKGAQVDEPGKLLQKILDDKGITQLVGGDKVLTLNDVLSHQRYYKNLSDVKPTELIKRQIVLHHSKRIGSKDLARVAATQDLQLLTGEVNNAVRKLETVASKRNLNTDEIAKLKNYGAKIQNFDGKIVGGGFTGPERQYKAIEKGAIDYAKSDQFNVKTVSKFLERLGCGDKVKAAEGGRILMGNGGDLTPCAKKGRTKLGNILTKGTSQTGDQLLATQILNAGKAIKNAATLKSLLGPQAMIFYAGTETALIGFDMVSKGKTLREAVADSVINYALGPKLKQNPQKLFVERLQNLGLSDQEIGKGLMFDRMTEDVQTLNNLLQRKFIADQKVEQSKQLYPGAVDKEEREPPGFFNFKSDKPFLSIPDVRDKRKKEADDIAMDIQDIYRTGDRNVLDALEFERFQKPETMKRFMEAKAQKDYLDEAVAADRLLDVQDNPFYKYGKGDYFKEKDREKIREIFDVPPDFKFAGGGIAKLAGIDEGPPPESGPNSQGLSGLLKRGNKI